MPTGLRLAPKQLANVGLELGPNGVQLFGGLRFTERAAFPSIGVRSCFQSHVRRFATIVTASSILEDDIAFCPSLHRMMPAIAMLLDRGEWDFVYFGHEKNGEVSRECLRQT